VEYPSVAVEGGAFSILLDGQQSLGQFGGVPSTLDVFLYEAGEMWLELEVEGTTMTPRQRIVAVPYAMVARDAERVGGHAASDLAMVDDLASLFPRTGGALDGSLDLASHPTQNLRLQAASAPPVICGPSTLGFVYLDTALEEVRVCFGASGWAGLGGPPPTPDTTPAGLGFAPLANQVPGQLVQSEVKLLTDHDGVTVNISGDGSPQFRICADAACSSVVSAYAATPRTLAPGQTLQLRATTASTPATARVITVTAGTESTQWTITTGSSACTTSNSCVFLTQAVYTGDLGGLAGADAKCTADANNPGGQARAMLATNGYNHQRGLTLAYPVLRASDGVQVAANQNQFFCHQENCGDWSAPLGSAAGAAWTGVVWIYGNGTVWVSSQPGWNCSNWTSASSSLKGNHGSPWSTSKPIPWMSGSDSEANTCAVSRPLICVTNAQ
jgi:hypothetical protein